MPEILRVALLGEGKRRLLEAIALGEPEATLEQLTVTAERFDLGADIEDAGVEVALACRGCGCTDDRACPSRCQLAEKRR